MSAKSRKRKSMSFNSLGKVRRSNGRLSGTTSRWVLPLAESLSESAAWSSSTSTSPSVRGDRDISPFSRSKLRSLVLRDGHRATPSADGRPSSLLVIEMTEFFIPDEIPLENPEMPRERRCEMQRPGAVPGIDEAVGKEPP